MSLMVAQEVPTSTTVVLPHGPTGVAEARRRLRSDLRVLRVPEPVVDDAVLILSELLSNSCRHARPLGDRGETDRLVGHAAHGGGEDRGRSRGTTGQAGAEAPAGRLADTMGGAGGPAPRTEPRTEPRTKTGTESRTDARTGPGTDGALGIRASWWMGEDGLLALEVTDGGGPTRPRPSRPSLTAHGGRGLGIVGSLALRWGVRDAPGEVTVWVLLPVRGRHARRDDSLGTGIGLPMGVPLDLPLDLAESLDDMG